MKETRRLAVSHKRFQQADLLAIAKMFAEEASVAPTAYQRLCFTLNCADGTTYESDSVDHLSPGGEIDLKVTNSITFTFYRPSPERRLDFSLTHRGGYDDALRVSGDDPKWVQSSFVRICERIDAASPSASWFTHHPSLTLHLCAFGLGALLVFGLQLSFIIAIKWFLPTATVEALRHVPPPQGAFWTAFVAFSSVPPYSWLYLWFLGLSWASNLRNWIVDAWPTIDLDVGPAHTRALAARRARIRVFATGVLTPLALRIVYDVGRSLFSK